MHTATAAKNCLGRASTAAAGAVRGLLHNAAKQQAAAAVGTTTFTRSMNTTGKALAFGHDSRARMLRGLNQLVDAVQVTMGPRGRTVAIEQPFGAPKITKDGVTVAKAIEFADHFENLGAQLVKQVAIKTNDVAGDGTTTSSVLARAIFEEGVRAVAAGMNPTDIRRGINEGIRRVVEVLREQSRPVDNTEKLAQVATISANHDHELGQLIAEAFTKVGNDGAIEVQNGQTIHTTLEVEDGTQIDRGFLSPLFINDPKTQKCVFEKPLILCYEGKIDNLHSFFPIIDQALRQNRPFVVMADDIEGDPLTALIMNRVRANVPVCAIRTPGFGDQRKEILRDYATIFGATVISPDQGMKLEETTVEHLGTCEKITIGKDTSVIVGGGGDRSAVAARADELREALKTLDVEYEKKKTRDRLARLIAKVGVIKVGGVSEVDIGERKDRIEDALNATRAALAEGIVPGGGSALLFASQALQRWINDPATQLTQDMRVGVEVLIRALAVPASAIVSNAGFEGKYVIGKLLAAANGDIKCTLGVDFRVDRTDKLGYKFVDMFEAGIVDPVKVVRTALEDAGSVASTLTTTEVALVQDSKHNNGNDEEGSTTTTDSE